MQRLASVVKKFFMNGCYIISRPKKIGPGNIRMAGAKMTGMTPNN